MKKTIALGIIILIIGFITCEKENNIDIPDNDVVDSIAQTYDTIKPLEYFPAFPSSFWIYSTGDTVEVYEEYMIYIYSEGTGYPNYDTVLLPKFKPNEIFGERYIYQYSFPQSYIAYDGIHFSGFLSETIGDSWSVSEYYQGHQIIGKTRLKDTSIIIQNIEYESVIMTIQYDNACIELGGLSEEACINVREYYAKGIGLIKRERGIYIPIEDWKTEFELISYYIHKQAARNTQ